MNTDKTDKTTPKCTCETNPCEDDGCPVHAFWAVKTACVAPFGCHGSGSTTDLTDSGSGRQVYCDCAAGRELQRIEKNQAETMPCFRCSAALEVSFRGEEDPTTVMVQGGIVFWSKFAGGSKFFTPHETSLKETLVLVVCDECVEAASTTITWMTWSETTTREVHETSTLRTKAMKEMAQRLAEDYEVTMRKKLEVAQERFKAGLPGFGLKFKGHPQPVGASFEVKSDAEEWARRAYQDPNDAWVVEVAGKTSDA